MNRNGTVLFGVILLCATGIVAMTWLRGLGDNAPVIVHQSLSASATPTLSQDPDTTLAPEDTASLSARMFDPILTAADAVSRTVAILPAEQHPRDGIARKMLETSYNTWQLQTTPPGRVRGELGMSDPHAVVWLVAMHVDAMNDLDLVPFPDIIDTSSALASSNSASFASEYPMSGSIRVVWNASTGHVITKGVLLDGTTQGYASVLALADEDIPIPTPFAKPFPEPLDHIVVTPDTAAGP